MNQTAQSQQVLTDLEDAVGIVWAVQSTCNQNPAHLQNWKLQQAFQEARRNIVLASNILMAASE